MTRRAVLHFLCMLGLFQNGRTAQIQTQQTVMAAVGEEAHLSCQLMVSKDVVQVTWWKEQMDLISYTKEYGQRVNPDFRDKVEFKDAGLQSSSIVIKNVTEQDEGCYQCLFNSVPEGAIRATTCLKVYELHEPILHVGQSNSAEEPVVSCSATGRPAPTVTLSVLKRSMTFSNLSSVSVTNTNGTVTVTTTAVLSGFHDDSTQVGCAVRVLSGPQIEVFKMVPEVKQSSVKGPDVESGSYNDDLHLTFAIVLSLIVTCFYVPVIIYVCYTLRNNNRSKMDETVKDAHEVQPLLIEQDNNQIRQRTPPERNRTSDNPTPSSPAAAARRLHFDQSQQRSDSERLQDQDKDS